MNTDAVPSAAGGPEEHGLPAVSSRVQPWFPITWFPVSSPIALVRRQVRRRGGVVSPRRARRRRSVGLATCLWIVALVAWSAGAAQRAFDLGDVATNAPPAGWRAALAGEGPPPNWQVRLDDAPGAVSVPAPGAASPAQQTVIAQVSTDPTDERYPLLIYDAERFGDFRLTLRFRTVAGKVERMAGVAFRLQDEKNFYVVRASTLGNSFRFYRVFKGARDAPIGPSVSIASGEWHELTVEARGNRFHFHLDGREPIPEVTDNTFAEGKLALWTKSDAVSHFTDLQLEYTPREARAQELVRDALQRYPRLQDLRLYATTTARPELHVVAAKHPADVGQPGGKTEQDVIARDTPFAGKARRSYLVTMPLHDLNGDAIGAVRIEMDTFPGQTEDNALARARPVVQRMERHVTTLKELTE